MATWGSGSSCWWCSPGRRGQCGLRTADPVHAWWRYGDIKLCLERVYRQGRCFLVSRDGGSESSPRYTADLLTWVDCDGQRIPVAYDSLPAITGCHHAPATIRDGACSRVRGDRTSYWSWHSPALSALICAAHRNR